MGNTCSSCFRGSSRERKEEDDQRLQKRHKRSRKTPVNVSEVASVTPNTSAIDRSETLCTKGQDADLENPDLPLEVYQPEVAPGQAALLEVDALPTQVKSDDNTSAVVADSVNVNTTFDVDNSRLLQHKEVAARFVATLLAEATKIVASEDPEKTKVDSLAMEMAIEADKRETFLESHLTQPEVFPDNSLFLERCREVSATLVSEVLAYSTKIVASEYVDEMTDKGDSLARETDKGDPVLQSHVPADATNVEEEVAARFVSKLLTDATEIMASYLAQDSVKEEGMVCHTGSQSPPINGLESQDGSALRESQAETEAAAIDMVAATVLESQAVEAKENVQDVSLPQEGATTTVTAEKLEDRLVQYPSAEDVVSDNVKDLESQDGSALRESPAETEAAATDSQVAATVLESQAAEAKENAQDVSLPQEGATTTVTAEKLEDRLVQNPSAEDVVSEDPKGFSLVPDTDAHLDSYEHQALFNKLQMEDGSIPVAKLDKRVGFMEKPETLGLSIQIPEHNIAGYLVLLDDPPTALHSSPQFERPVNADRLTPMSDGSDTWLACEEDLYNSEEEVEKEPVSLMEMTVPEQDHCSLEQPVDILVCSEREWKGQMNKVKVMRKGYTVLSHSFRCLRQVREDNYSALRASLYQALMRPSQPPDWLFKDSFLMIPQDLESSYGLIKHWPFPDICMQMFWIRNAVDRMKHCLCLLQKWWHAAASSGIEGRSRVCELLFQGGEEEFGIMEALKLLMLARAVEFYTVMQRGDSAPFLFWLLFGRDSSPCPRTFLVNHLSQVGFSGGVKQMEMSLLGYALQHTIKVYRLHKANTGEFITYYPVDHLQDWPSICLVTKDDQHYNVPIGHNTHPLCRTSMIGLYHSDEEVEREPVRRLMEMTVPEQDHCSLERPVDILVCSEREWKGQMDKNMIIRRGYTVLSHSFRCLRQVREDNYSALRASLYQALMSASQPPDWLLKDTFLLIPEELESFYGLIKLWPFPDICTQLLCIKNAVDCMKHYLCLLQKWWRAAASSGLEGRRRVCELLFQGGEEEFGIMEALKLLMLARAVEFYTAMQRGDDVPLLIRLLFTRDSSPCPRTLLVNHLSKIGLSGHVEQMEMSLLGYALQHTIKVYRLHKASTGEFITHYPVDHLQDWPSVCLVTKDDQHYNVPVGHPTHPLWRTSMIGQPAFVQQLDC